MTAKGRIVLDASALLAYILREPGGHLLTRQFLAPASISTVNLAEVQSILVRGGYDPKIAWDDASALVPQIEPYTAEQAKIAGSLITHTQSRGLSLGDRSCLALALTLNAPVYTTDQIWRTLDLGIQIHILR